MAPRPAMSHSSAFLLPSPSAAAAGADAPPAPPPASGTAVRVCADGGANRVYKPDVIKGDLDSVRPEVKEYYSNMGTQIVDESHDQDTTDLHKCVAFITENSAIPNKSNLCIFALGALGGRFDHEMGNINVLHLFPNNRIILLSDDCLIFLLPRTHTHNIHIERSIEGPHCGLIPIGAPSATTTTTGLQWNLDNTSMSFGGLISTSNIVREESTVVTITSDSDLIWTISLRHHS
uniref:Thiamine pyrophosphokinase n=1 Tax=Oryza rufipogon TaxID=4529 RepID=A0A0E0PLI6_ORYRU